MKNFLFLLFLCPYLLSSAQVNTLPVFVSGTDGYASYRIPAIVRLPGGKLLVFAEGRVRDADDFGNIDIVMKHSSDNGRTWSAIQTVADNDTLQAGNPAPVVDLSDPAFPSGRLFLFYNTGNNREGEVRKGRGLREVWYKTSVDGGKTWSAGTNITTAAHRPNQPAINPAYHFVEDWRSYAITPGHAMQFTGGKYKGRIYVAANHSAGAPRKAFRDYVAHGFYTDDHGKTFHLGESLAIAGSNESMAVEISGGRLLMNARNQQGNVKARIVALSADGGATWEKQDYDLQLPDPVCQGSILWLGWKKGKAVLAFSNAADTSRRDNLTLRISDDDGVTWNKSFVVAKSGNNQRNYAAYSDLVWLDSRRIGILFEKDNYGEIVFGEIRWK